MLVRRKVMAGMEGGKDAVFFLEEGKGSNSDGMGKDRDRDRAFLGHGVKGVMNDYEVGVHRARSTRE